MRKTKLVPVFQKKSIRKFKNCIFFFSHTSGYCRFLMGRDKSRAHLHASHRIDPIVEQQLEDLKQKLIEVGYARDY